MDVELLTLRPKLKRPTPQAVIVKAQIGYGNIYIWPAFHIHCAEGFKLLLYGQEFWRIPGCSLVPNQLHHCKISSYKTIIIRDINPANPRSDCVLKTQRSPRSKASSSMFLRICSPR